MLKYDATILVSFGGPEGMEDVLPFLRNVSKGRNIPDERLLAVSGHYEALGGVSPINAINRELRQRLESDLTALGIKQPLYQGNRNWDPYLVDELRNAINDGNKNLIAVLTSAYSSYSSCRQYQEDIEAAVQELDSAISVDVLPPYFTMRGFVEPFIDGLRGALSDLETRSVATSDIDLLFTTHSIPLQMEDRSGPEGSGGVYVEQHRVLADYIVTTLAQERTVPQWSLVYQSRSGHPSQPWLEPDVGDVISESSAQAVIVIPLGFVSDHVEVVWDLDTVARKAAHDKGMMFIRTPTPSDDHRFTQGLADRIASLNTGEPVRDGYGSSIPMGSWKDLPMPCPQGCCAKPDRFIPQRTAEGAQHA